jgi:putative tricarboxylic transport membrane protein
MTALHNLIYGFSVALTPMNLLYCLAGATLGTLVGVLPGMAPTIVITMLLPLTFKIPATSALIMLAGIYYGSHHAGSTTAIMLNMPGEPSSVVICLDGHPMARNGRAGTALSISALSSFFAGCAAVIVVALLSPALATAALSFQAPEYTSTIVLALVGVSVLAGGALLETLAMAVVGLLLGTVGTDVDSGVLRFTFGMPQLDSGIDFVPVAVGIFAIAEISYHLGISDYRSMDVQWSLKGLIPTKAEFLASWKPILRGTTLGALLGIIPGVGPMLSSFASYTMEKKLAKDSSRFGHGAIEGVAGPEAADNAAVFTHFIPMLTLGIPAGATMALMLGAMLIQGITPGPQVMVTHPDLFWGLIASMWIGNIMLLVLNLPLIGIWIRLLSMPYRLLFPAILTFSCIGVYSINNSAFDVGIAAFIGVLGYLFRRLGLAPAPLVLGLILGPILEENLRRSMLISQGDPSIFITRPISLVLLLAAIGIIVFSVLSGRRKRGAKLKAQRA